MKPSLQVPGDAVAWLEFALLPHELEATTT
jgi:hypothetical protein